MSRVFPQGIKDLKISGPTNVGQSLSALRCKVILVAKFDFAAETEGELSIKKGDVLKLLDRLANGWVLVEFIDKIASSGLVPSLYVDIAVNDPINPITLLWLHEVAPNGTVPSKTFNDVQVQMLLDNNTPFSINNKLYPLTVSVTNYLMYENRFWYRVDVTYSLGEQGYLCRYYLDFYDLHVSLLDYVHGTPETDAEGHAFKLPKLPEPVPSQRRNSTEQGVLFSQRCRELSTYMNELIATKRFQVCPALVDWLDVKYKDLPGFVVDDAPEGTTDIVNQRILPGSVILASKAVAPVLAPPSLDPEASETPAEGVTFSATPSKDGPRPNKPKNVYNHYQQAASAKINIARSLSTSEGRYPTRSTSKLERLRTVSSANNALAISDPVAAVGAGNTPLFRSKSTKATHAPPKAAQVPPNTALPLMTPRQKFTPDMAQTQTPPGRSKRTSPTTSRGEDEAPGLKTPISHQGTPKQATNPSFPVRKASYGTPVPGNTQKLPSPKHLRCEIKTQTNDNLVVRVNVAETPSVASFKAAVYLKCAYNNLFIREEEGGSYEEIDYVDFDVVQMIQKAEKVFLLVT